MKTSGWLWLAAVAAGMAQAAEINIDKDAFIRNGTYADTSYGALNTTRVRNSSLGATFKTYLEADVTSALSAGQTFTNAAVKLTAAVTAATTGQIGLRIYGIVDNNDSWNESTITWNNAPKNDTASNFAPLELGTKTVLLQTVIVGINAFTQDSVWTFSGAAIDQYLNWTAGAIADPYGNGNSTDKKATFIIGAVQVGPNFDFYSSEHSTGPAARVEYTVNSSAVEQAATIVGITPSGNLMELQIYAPTPSLSALMGRTDLTSGSWTNVAFSDNGTNSFVATNLTYSTSSDTNLLIYVERDDVRKFFGIGPVE